jgi:hypothetical protein
MIDSSYISRVPGIFDCIMNNKKFSKNRAVIDYKSIETARRSAWRVCIGSAYSRIAIPDVRGIEMLSRLTVDSLSIKD